MSPSTRKREDIRSRTFGEASRAALARLDQQRQFTAITDLMEEEPTVMASGSGVRLRDVDGSRSNVAHGRDNFGAHPAQMVQIFLEIAQRRNRH